MPILLRPKQRTHSAQSSTKTEALIESAASQPTTKAHDPNGANFGTLTIDSAPWSYVTLNNKMMGATPVIGLKLEPGTYQVNLKNPELGLESTYPVTVKASQTITRRFGLY